MNYYLRKANFNDCYTIYNWANEELVRKSSFNSNKICYEDHIKWFANKVSSNNSKVYIFCDDNSDIGIVRIDVDDRRGIISYSIDKKYRGLGLAKIMLFLLEKRVLEENAEVKELIGYVMLDNLRSQRIFEGLGYMKYMEKDSIRYIKILS